jgi:RNA polymerase sigma-70 factor (ECF subfamily)
VATPQIDTAPGGDRRAAFERLAMPQAGALYRAAHRLSGRPEDAADLVQETFLRAYRTFDGFKPGTNAKAWLFTILYSILANRWRAERRSPRDVPMVDAEDRFASLMASPEANAEQALLARLDASVDVDAALRALPDEQRAAVLLVDVEELTYEEAAAALACPVGTVRSRLARGRRHLCAALMDYARRTGVLRDR